MVNRPLWIQKALAFESNHTSIKQSDAQYPWTLCLHWQVYNSHRLLKPNSVSFETEVNASPLQRQARHIPPKKRFQPNCNSAGGSIWSDKRCSSERTLDLMACALGCTSYSIIWTCRPHTQILTFSRFVIGVTVVPWPLPYLPLSYQNQGAERDFCPAFRFPFQERDVHGMPVLLVCKILVTSSDRAHLKCCFCCLPGTR